LDDVVLLHDLQSNRVCGPLLVDGYDHAAAGYGKCGSDAGAYQ
jgi:hypothetical protein